jgi:hypothetical protein
MQKLRFGIVLLAVSWLLPGLTPAQSAKTGKSGKSGKAGVVQVKRASYRGWSDALVITNGLVEAVIVPAVGRVMQFRFVNEEGVFWESDDWAGKAPNASSNTWSNFGGDKAWPAPQSDWPKVTPRSWPPPAAFDSMPVQAEIKGEAVELLTPVDPHLGIRVRRLIRLAAKRPVLTITTTFEKIEGDPRTVAVWVITQLKDPQMVYLPLPAATINAAGYVLQSKTQPPSLKREGQLLALRRDAQTAYKIGTDASTLLWLGERYALRIDSPRALGAPYPDQGSSAEVYTNPDPAKYVELEMLGPLSTLKAGDRLARTNVYTLARRQPKAMAPKDMTEEARRLLGQK